jgi:hypothetical protein
LKKPTTERRNFKEKNMPAKGLEGTVHEGSRQCVKEFKKEGARGYNFGESRRNGTEFKQTRARRNKRNNKQIKLK